MKRARFFCHAVFLVAVSLLLQCGDDSNQPAPDGGGGSATSVGASTSAGMTSGASSGTGGGGPGEAGRADASGGSAGSSRDASSGDEEGGTCPTTPVSRLYCTEAMEICTYATRTCTCQGHDLGILLWECEDKRD